MSARNQCYWDVLYFCCHCKLRMHTRTRSLPLGHDKSSTTVGVAQTHPMVIPLGVIANVLLVAMEWYT